MLLVLDMNPVYSSPRNVSRFSKPFYKSQQYNPRSNNPCYASQQFYRSSISSESFLQRSNLKQDMFQQRTFSASLILYIIRGLPGSGKSTLARSLCCMDGVILSTDDYFKTPHGYHFNPSVLTEAHDWNKKRANDNLIKGISPVVIDNTNLADWEMRPYMLMAVDHGYEIKIVEPDTWWKYDVNELAKRNVHRVPKETISNMLSRFEKNVTIEGILGKQKFAQYQRLRLRHSPTQRYHDHRQQSAPSHRGHMQRGNYHRNHFEHSAFNSGRGSSRGRHHRGPTPQRSSTVDFRKTKDSGRLDDDVTDAFQALNLNSQQRPSASRSCDANDSRFPTPHFNQRSRSRQNQQRSPRKKNF